MTRETMIRDLIEYEISWAIENNALDETKHITDYVYALSTSVYTDEALKKMWMFKLGDPEK